MAITLNGSSQYITLPNGTNFVSARPYGVAALIKRASGTATWDGILSLGPNNGSRCFSMECGDASDGNHLWVAYNTETSNKSTFAVPQNVWVLVGAGVVDAGASSTIYYFMYRYDTNTLTLETHTGAADSNPSVIAGDVCGIGVWFDSSSNPQDLFSGQLGWVAGFAYDITSAASSTSPFLWELISNGPWNMLDANCDFFMPFSNAAIDLSGGGKNGTLVGSPSYSGGYVGEAPTWQVFPVTHSAPAGGTTQDLAGQSDVVHSATGDLAVTKLLAGQSDTSLSVSGALSVTKGLAGQSDVTFGVSGDTTVTKPLAGQSDVVFGVSGTANATWALSGQADVTFGVSGAAGVTKPLSGQSDTAFGVSGALDLTKTLAGQSDTVFGVSGDIVLTKPLAGQSDVLFGLSAAIDLTKPLVGQSDVVFGISGTLTTGGLPPLFRATSTVTVGGQASATLDITQASATLDITQASTTLTITQASSTVDVATQATATVTQGTQAEASVTYYGN